jgi:response regulator of citrate/malate metabolism
MRSAALETALVVDDNAGWLDRFICEYEGWFRRNMLQVVGAQTVAGAKRVLRTQRDGVALIIVDIYLPTPRQSHKLLTFVRDYHPGVRRIGITGLASSGQLSYYFRV